MELALLPFAAQATACGGEAKEEARPSGPFVFVVAIDQANTDNVQLGDVYGLDLDGVKVQVCSSCELWGVSPGGRHVAYSTYDVAAKVFSDANVYSVDGSRRVLDAGAIYWSPSGERMAYIGAHGDVFLALGDGADPIVVSNVNNGYAEWAPDGRRLAVASENNVVIGDDQASTLVTLPTRGGVVQWAPDSSRLAVIGFDGQSLELVNGDGSGYLLMPDDARFIGWSADAAWFTFGIGDATYVASADGSVTTSLPGYGPAWSPVDAVLASGELPAKHSLYFWSPESAYSGPLFALEQDLAVYDFQWSPDGSKLLVPTLGMDLSTHSTLLVDASTGIELARFNGNNGEWNADSSRLLVAGYSSPGWQVTDPLGADPAQIVDAETGVHSVTWLADGQHVGVCGENDTSIVRVTDLQRTSFDLPCDVGIVP